MDNKRCQVIIELLKKKYQDYDIKYSYEIQSKIDNSVVSVLRLDYDNRFCSISILKETPMSYYYLRVDRFITLDNKQLCHKCNTTPDDYIMVRCAKCPESICGKCYLQSYIKGRGLIKFKCCNSTVGMKLQRSQYNHGLIEISNKIKIN